MAVFDSTKFVNANFALSRSLGTVAQYGLQLEELIEGVVTELASVARALVPAERCGQIHVGVVDVDVTRAKL
jgi:hypothetical protein